jgi:Zn-dependent protease
MDAEAPNLDPPRDQTFANPVEEADFQRARHLLLYPPPRRQKLNLLVLSFAAFAVVWLVQGSGTLNDLGILIVVLIVHELGHAIGMRAFGYRDVTVFFIPLFGAAASGRPRGVARSKQAIVLLLGPLPGIIAGCVLAWIDGPAWLHTTAVMLIWVNALNLIPVEPLDGGQLFQVLVFSRHRILELVFRGVTAAVVVAASLYWHFWVLAVFGYLLIITLPERAKLLRAATTLGRIGLPEDPAALDEAQQRTLYRAMWDSVPATWNRQWRGKPQLQADRMEAVLRRASERPPSVLASLGIAGLWFAGLALVVVGAIAVVQSPHAPLPWQRYESATAPFAVDMPANVVVAPSEQDAAHRTYDATATAVWRGTVFHIAWIAVPSSIVWMRKMHAQYEDHRARDGFEDEYVWGSSAHPQLRMKLYARDGFGYMLSVTPGDDPNVRRMFDSFQMH